MWPWTACRAAAPACAPPSLTAWPACLQRSRTSLRPTIAHCLARLACIQPGEVVADLCAGSGTIPIETARSMPWSYCLGGAHCTMLYCIVLPGGYVPSHAVPCSTALYVYTAWGYTLGPSVPCCTALYCCKQACVCLWHSDRGLRGPSPMLLVAVASGALLLMAVSMIGHEVLVYRYIAHSSTTLLP